MASPNKGVRVYVDSVSPAHVTSWKMAGALLSVETLLAR